MEELPKYYEILGLARSARPEAIRAVYQKLIQLYHPDRASDAQKEEFGKLAAAINEAYKILSNASSRLAYDKRLDEEALAAKAAAESYSQTYTGNFKSESSDHPRSDARSTSGGGNSNYEYTEYGAFNRSMLLQMYADAKNYVIRTQDPTKQGLKRKLRRDDVAPRLLDELATRFLDHMCHENILSKTTGGATRYHFVEADDDEVCNDHVEAGADYEETTARSTRTAKTKPKNDLAGCLAVIFWLIVGGWWAWHHFISQPASEASETPAVPSTSPGSDQMVKPQTTQVKASADAPNAQTLSMVQGAAAEAASAPASELTSTPLLESTGSSSIIGSTASADTTIRGEDIPSTSPTADWRIVRETPPTYPIAALRSGEFGTTVVEVKLDAAGNVIQARVQTSSGYRDLDWAAVRAVRKFEFAPADSTGSGRGGTVLVPINFQRR